MVVGLSGVVVTIRYKTPDDKPLNAFGFGEKALDKKHALEVRTTAIDQHARPLTAPGPTLTPPGWLAGWLQVIEETHGFWKDLQSGKAPAGKLWKA